MTGNKSGLKKLVDDLQKYEPQKRKPKVHRTLSLDKDMFKEVKDYCEQRKMPVSELFDKLMAEFLNELRPSDSADSPEINPVEAVVKKSA